MNNLTLRKYHLNDNRGITEIFNYFGTKSFACYFEHELSEAEILEKISNSLFCYVYENDSDVIGFGFVSRYRNSSTFNQTGVLSYFLKPEYTNMGLGTRLFNQLIQEAKRMGINNFLAHISSKNEQSINFHKKMGFEKVGRLKKIAVKFGEPIDIVWVQKIFGEEH